MEKQFNSVQRFSLRKYSLGVASVLLGAFFLSQGQLVSADQVLTGETDVAIQATDEKEIALEVILEKSEESSADQSLLKNTNTELNESASIATESPYVSEQGVAQTEPSDEKTVTKGYAATTTDRPESSISTDSTRRRAPKNTRKAPAAFQSTARGFAKETVMDDQLGATEKETTLAEVPQGKAGFFKASNGSAVGDDYPQAWKTPNLVDRWGYYTANCTSFVANRLSKVNGFEMPRAIGHGGQWGDSARRLGYRVDNTPAPGSVAYFTAGPYGHVAWVAAVEGNRVLIEEYNWQRTDGSFDYSYHVRYQPISAYTGFIHFKDLASGAQVQATSHTPSSQGEAQSGTYTFTKRSSIRAAASMDSPELAYYDAGQTVNYDRKVTENGYEWLSYLSFAGNRRYIAIKEVAKPADSKPLSGTITIQNNNATTGTFDVVISNVHNPKGVQAVVVPTWSDKDGQDDIKWYQASKQSDGTYKLTVKASDHKNVTGLYHAHLYYRQNDGTLVGAGGTTTTVTLHTPKDEQANIPASGTYRFTTRVAVRPETRITSAELAYYNPGMSVHYDRVLQVEGRTWISYIAASGNRRYIAIN